jgi:hypothetical protein
MGEEFKADAGQTGHSMFPVPWASRHPHPLPPREEARAIRRYVLAVSMISGSILPIAIFFFILYFDLCLTHPLSHQSFICPYHIWVAYMARFGRPTQRTLERNFPTPLPDKHNLSCDSKPPVFPQHQNHGNNGC